MIARTRVETIGRCLPLESGKLCTLFHSHQVRSAWRASSQTRRSRRAIACASCCCDGAGSAGHGRGRGMRRWAGGGGGSAGGRGRDGMGDLRAGGSHQAADVACQRQQRTGGHPRHGQLCRNRALKIRCGAPDQAPAPVWQGNGDEPRAAGTGKGQDRQPLAVQGMARVSDGNRRDQPVSCCGSLRCLVRRTAAPIPRSLGWRSGSWRLARSVR